MRITPHFTQAEFTRSQAARRLGLDNEPAERQWAIIEGLCREVLEPVRERFGPVYVSSGYRAPAVNKEVRGSARSDHQVLGRCAAADIVTADMGDVFRWIYIQLPWSRLIWEYGEWIHVSWSADGRPGNRRPQVKAYGEDFRAIGFEEIVRLGRE